MSCLDEVESCLERAGRSFKACLEGITKADLALRETKGDSDIQCVVLVKRTELLYIAVSICTRCIVQLYGYPAYQVIIKVPFHFYLSLVFVFFLSTG